MLEEKIVRLREELAKLNDTGNASGYLYDMWVYALDNILKSEAEIDRSADCDAVPYLPVELKGTLTELGKNSVVLDVGCLGGYGLFDIAERQRRDGRPVPSMIGVDIEEMSIAIGTKMAEVWVETEEVELHRRSAENLLLDDEAADVVVARLVLPYIRLNKAMKEMARVLKKDGQILLQYHSFAYYTDCLIRRSGTKKKSYYLRAVLSGIIFMIFRRQPKNQFFAETALNDKLLVRVARKHGLEVDWRGGFKRKPLVLFRKT